MALRCKIWGHNWGDWCEWEERDEIFTNEMDGVVVSARRIKEKKRHRNCKRCGKYDWEYDYRDWQRMDTEEYYSGTDVEESVKAHIDAKDSDYPVSVGEYVTCGIEDFSKHYQRGNEPLIRHKGFVIFVKNAPKNLKIGDVVTVKVSSFNKGDSANAVFIKKSEG